MSKHKDTILKVRIWLSGIETLNLGLILVALILASIQWCYIIDHWLIYYALYTFVFALLLASILKTCCEGFVTYSIYKKCHIDNLRDLKDLYDATKIKKITDLLYCPSAALLLLTITILIANGSILEGFWPRLLAGIASFLLPLFFLTYTYTQACTLLTLIKE